MDETYVINQLKEDTSFVSTDFNRDMAIAQKKGKDNAFLIDYVLPDFTTLRRGYIRPKDEVGSGEQVKLKTAVISERIISKRII